MHIDIIVIGSGFAGAVAASRFAEKGLKVLVLERGPWRQTAPVIAAGVVNTEKLPSENRPGLILRHIRPSAGPKQITLNKKGMLELHIGKGVKTLSSSNVGGGSHLWSGLVARPKDPNYWNGWTNDLTEEVMAPHYGRVRGELAPVHPENARDLPNHTSYAWREKGWFNELPETEQFPSAISYPEPFAPTGKTSKYASELAGHDGMFGAKSGSKANADAIYLLPHLNNGITVLDMHEVQLVGRNGLQGYKVHARDIRNRKEVSFTADRVVLAAGTMNTNKILCDGLEQDGLAPMPGLGKGFGTNTDCLATWEPRGEHKNSQQGAPVHGTLRVEGQDDEVTILSAGMESPPMPTWLPKFLATKIQNVGNKFQLVAMAEDDANGNIGFRGGRLHLNYQISENPAFNKVFSALEKIAEVSESPVTFDRKSAFTAHPLGGARVSDSVENGVVNGKGEVYNNPGLYITDASVFPAATGGPPTFSIAAWSSYVASQILEEISISNSQ